MKKRRKPNKQRSEDRRQLTAWSRAVRARAEFKCELCGCTHKYLNSHHIIGKRYRPFRYALENGVAVCPKCHKWGIGYAAHENPIIIYRWLETNRPDALQYLIEFMKKGETYDETPISTPSGKSG